MRVLHTADWHVGKTLHRRQRLDEVAGVLDEVVEIAREQAVDLTLVCGDIFDQFAPSAAAERIVYRALVDLRATGCAVLAIPGNHDNARRFEAIERLSAAAGIQFVPTVRRPDEGGMVEITSRDGAQVAQVAALPWVPEKQLYGAEEMMGLEGDPNAAYAEELARLLSALCSSFAPGKIHLLAAHLFVGGARVGGGERTFTIGDLFAITPQGLPTTPQYIALGHVHRPQTLAAAAIPARYSGSLLQLDFGEREQDKSVTIVDVDPGRPAKITEIPVTSGSRLIDVEGTLDQLREMAIDPDAYVRVNLQCDGPAPGLADLVREIIPRALDVRLQYERQGSTRTPGDARRLTPHDLFAQYYRHRYGSEAGEPLMALFDELFEEVTGAAA